MGQCGCGDHREGFKLDGPDGLIYHLSPYAGCEYCYTGPGWSVWVLPAGDEDFFCMRKDPPLPIHRQHGFLPAVDPGPLTEALRQEIGAEAVEHGEVARALPEAAWVSYRLMKKLEEADA